MLRIDQIRLLPGDSEALLPGKCARILRLPAEDIVSCAVLRRAIDAREGLTLVYTAAVEVKREDTVLRRCRDKRVSRYATETYALPAAVTVGDTVYAGTTNLDGMIKVRVEKEYQDTSYYNVFTVEGTAASRVFFRIVA